MLKETRIMFYSVALLIVLILEIRGELPVRDNCPNVSVQKNLNVSQYMGKWYLYAQYPEILGPKSHCLTEEFKMINTEQIELKISRINLITQREHNQTVTLKPDRKSKDKEAKYVVDIPDVKLDPPFPYWIISTDYKSYAIVWSCRQLKLKRNIISMRRLWLITRDIKPSDDIVQKMRQIIISKELDGKHLELTDHTDCKVST